MLEPVSLNPESDSRLAYSQGILVRGETRTLFIAGQVGIDPAGVVAPGFEAQARQAWSNLLAVLVAANMEVGRSRQDAWRGLNGSSKSR
jgi:enamine deaminase RidA (YjgF/YER057c/UK114 family)